MQFSQPSWQIFSLGTKVFCSLPINGRKKRFSQIVFFNFFQNASMIFCTRGLYIYNLVKDFLSGGRKLLAHFPKTIKYWTFFIRLFLLKKILGSRTTESWQPYQHFLSRRPKKFRSGYENFERIRTIPPIRFTRFFKTSKNHLYV